MHLSNITFDEWLFDWFVNLSASWLTYLFATPYTFSYRQKVFPMQFETHLAKMLMGMLMMSHMYAVAIGANIFTSSNLSYVADTIALQCHDWLKVRSRLELAKACSSEASCRAIRTDEWGTSSMWCACPKRITWPRTWNYDLSTIRQIRLANPLPGLIHMWFKAPNLRLQNQKHLCQKKIWKIYFRKTHLQL